MRPVLALVLALLVSSGCASSDPEGLAGQPAAASQPPPSGSVPATTDTAATPSLAPSEPFPIATVTLHGPNGEAVEVPVYVASTRQQRARGLMGRTDLPDGTGMVFVFPDDSTGAFYMYRTLLPLSIAFADADGRVVALLDMEPCEAEEPAACPRYAPGWSYRTALEVEQGFFDELGVTSEWRLELPPDLPPPA